MLPVEYRPRSVPTCVMLGWKGWLTTSATLAFATLPTRAALWMLLRALPCPLKYVAVTFPDEYRPRRVPTCVILGWKGWLTTSATLALATLPTRAALWILLRALP